MTKKKILIDAVFKNETRGVLINSADSSIEEIEYQTANKQQIKSNIYLAKVIRVERSLQAAFIDYGSGKNGFLSFSEIHPDYYNKPVLEQNNNIAQAINLKPITPPEITSNDLDDRKEGENLGDNIKNLEQPLNIDDKPDEINLGIDENEVDKLDSEAYATSAEQASKQYKIEEVIKKGQVLLVQAEKEKRGNKGASFTTYITLAGKYCVLMPNQGGQNGISRRISKFEERKRLKNLIAEFNSQQDNLSHSIIVRTAGVGRSAYELKRDYDYLVRLWNRICEVTKNSKAPAFIHMEEDIIHKIIRDLFDHNVDEILIQGTEAYNAAKDFIQNILPSDRHKVKEYTSKVPIFTKYNIEQQLSTLYQPIASLPSGGYIVINPTEALIAIDVNSGKSTSEKNIEETAFKTNLEAVKEIARQVRLRDLSGLIVIDFIDMDEAKNRKLVEKALRDCFIRDKARIQLGNISAFGLLEMSRQRLRQSFTESNAVICNHCNGKGIVRADESNAMLILRTIENEIYNGEYDKVHVYTTLSTILYILNYKRAEIEQIENKYDIKLGFFNDPKATAESFSIEKIKLTSSSALEKKASTQALISNADLYDIENEDIDTASSEAISKKIKSDVTKVETSKSEQSGTPQSSYKKLSQDLGAKHNEKNGKERKNRTSLNESIVNDNSVLSDVVQETVENINLNPLNNQEIPLTNVDEDVATNDAKSSKQDDNENIIDKPANGYKDRFISRKKNSRFLSKSRNRKNRKKEKVMEGGNEIDSKPKEELDKVVIE